MSAESAPSRGNGAARYRGGPRDDAQAPAPLATGLARGARRMKLAPKLAAGFIVVAATLLAATGALRIRRELAIAEADVRRDHEAVGRAVAGAARAVLRNEGADAARAAIEDAAGGAHMTLRWVCRPAGAPLASTCAELAALGDGSISRVVAHDGRELRVTYVPFGEGASALEVSEARDAETGYARRAIVDNVTAGAVLATLFAALSFGLSLALVGRPVGRLVEKARKVGDGDFSGPLPEGSGDELGELSREMNAMCERLARAHDELERQTTAKVVALEQLRHADRLRTVGQLASGIAHEVGTPLNVIGMRAGLIAGGELDAADARESATAIVDAADHITKVVQKLLLFARRQSSELVPCRLPQIAARAVELTSTMAARGEVIVSIDERVTSTVDADPTLLQQAIMNLLVNAIQASPRGSRVDVVLDEAPLPDDRARATSHVLSRGDLTAALEAGARLARVCVRDRGPGVPAELAPRLFEPFFTTKPAGEGTGLGLAIASGIVHELGGVVDVARRDGGGTSVDVYLPPAGARS